MSEIWERNEEHSGEEELVATAQRDGEAPAVTPGAEQSVQHPEGDNPRDALEVQGEDVASSPARRGHQDRDWSRSDDHSSQ
ncbi:hypothetical protein [Leucobacter sp. 7(1)]|uniref:hypothetical protein n=1 Tax=Leucobacter sp. 7(1) TaxID=1255613 RepID=UPI000B35F339|nr:hypothetical protein [Leucobacter sp. 7(1)]